MTAKRRAPAKGRGAQALAGSRADWALDRLSSLRAMAAFWSVYAIVFALLRLTRSSYVVLDDAISAEVSQRVLLPAYSARNPPLYEWCLWAVQQVFGAGVGGHLVLRSLLIVAIGVAMFEAVRGLSRDPRLAAAASLGLLTFFAIAWQAHIALTQSLFVFLILLVMIRLLDSFCRAPNALRAAALGLVMGLGILGKWSFALPVGAAFIVLLLDPRARRAGIGPFVLIVAACGVALLPTAYYLINVHADLAGTSKGVLFGEGAENYWSRVAFGLSGVVAKTAAFFVPFVVFVIAAYRRLRLWPRYHEGDASAQLVSRFVVVQALVLLTAIFAVGIANVTERYVYTLAVPMALAFYLSFAVPPVRETVLRFVVNGAFISTAVILAIKLALIAEALLPSGRTIDETLPYPALAQELESRGYGAASIIVSGPEFGGNLMAQMPATNILSIQSTRLRPPRTYTVQQACLLIWPDDKYGKDIPEFMNKHLPAVVPPVQALAITGSNGGIGAPRSAVWHLLDIGRDAEMCRIVVGMRQAP
jgi:hypothetical protein